MGAVSCRKERRIFHVGSARRYLLVGLVETEK